MYKKEKGSKKEKKKEKGSSLPLTLGLLLLNRQKGNSRLDPFFLLFSYFFFYYLQKQPDWTEVLKGKDGKLFSIVVLDNSTGIDGEGIASFDYDKLLSGFEKPLELRKIDYKKYPGFRLE